MEAEKFEEIIMSIIISAGEAKMYGYEALESARLGNFEKSAELISQAQVALNAAHAAQTDVIRAEASGESVKVTIMFVHAQDHLMTVISDLKLLEQMVEMQKEIFELKQKVGK